MEMKRLFKKIICLAACLCMFMGSTVTASAKWEWAPGYGKTIAVVSDPVSGMTKDVIRNTAYEHVYYSKDGGETCIELAGTWEIPETGPYGSPLWLRPDTNDENILYVYEAFGTTPGGIWVYADWSKIYLDDQIAFLYAMIDNAGIKNEMSEYDKCVAINNYICGVMQYGGEYAAVGKPNIIGKTNPDPAWYWPDDGLMAMFVTGGGVCADYADLFETMCETIGIRCEVINGYVKQGPHAWNDVVADGKTYYIDVTWNDSLGNGKYFMSETQWSDHEPYKYKGYDEYSITMEIPARRQAIAAERFKGRTMTSQPYVELTYEEYCALSDQMRAAGITW